MQSYSGMATGGSRSMTGTTYWLGLSIFVLASAVIFILQTRHGIGVLPDSTRYMRVAPTSYDAPLYTWLLDGVRALGIDLAEGARAIGFVLVCLNTALVWHILNRGDVPVTCAIIGTALVVLAPSFTIGHSVAMSEPVFFFFIFCSVIALAAFFRSGAKPHLLASGVAAGAATLARFSALPLSAAIGIAILANARRSIRQRLVDAISFAIVDGGIFMSWVAASMAMKGNGIGREMRLYGNPDWDRWMSGLETLSTLIVPGRVPGPVRYALLFVALLICVVLISRCILVTGRAMLSKRAIGDDVIPLVLALFAPLYVVFLIVAVNIEANLPLTTRYALPLYVTLVITLTFAAARREVFAGSRVLRWSLSGLVLVLLLGNAARTTVQGKDAFANGIGFSSVDWATSPLVKAVNDLPAEALIFTNAPDALNFLTGRSTRYVPLKFERRTGAEGRAGSSEKQVSELSDALRGQNAYMVFADKVDWRFYLMSEDELKSLLSVTVYKELEDGRIYVSSASAGSTSNGAPTVDSQQQ